MSWLPSQNPDFEVRHPTNTNLFQGLVIEETDGIFGKIQLLPLYLLAEFPMRFSLTFSIGGRGPAYMLYEKSRSYDSTIVLWRIVGLSEMFPAI
jgi:hypothetical protein